HALVLLMVVAATVIVLLQDAGVTVFASMPTGGMLPAATTTVTPSWVTSLMAFCMEGSLRAQVFPAPSEAPRLMLMTLAASALAGRPATVRPAAHRMASSMSVNVPPQRPRARTGTIFAFQFTPATPTALLVAAPIVPATCVPCQLFGKVPVGQTAPS